MTDPDQKRDQEAGEGEGDEDASTPFDNPWFLPVVLLGFALWMAYDGFLNQEFLAKAGTEDAWHIAFNRWGAVVAGLAGAWLAARALRSRGDSAAD